MLCTNFTRYCACNRSVLPDIALAGGSVVLTTATTRPLDPAIDRSIGVWETQPIWDNLIAFFDLLYLAVISGLSIASRSGSCAWPGQWLCILHHTQLGAAVGYHRASLLYICYCGSMEHVSEGLHEYLHAFWGPGSHTKWKYIPLTLAAGSTPKKRSNT